MSLKESLQTIAFEWFGELLQLMKPVFTPAARPKWDLLVLSLFLGI